MGPGMGKEERAKNGGEEWDGVMISVVEWVWDRGSLWGRGDVAMKTGDLLFFLLLCSLECSCGNWPHIRCCLTLGQSYPRCTSCWRRGIACRVLKGVLRLCTTLLGVRPRCPPLSTPCRTSMKVRGHSLMSNSTSDVISPPPPPPPPPVTIIPVLHKWKEGTSPKSSSLKSCG